MINLTIKFFLSVIILFMSSISLAEETIFDLSCYERPSPFLPSPPDAVQYNIHLDISAKTALIQSTNTDFNCAADDLILKSEVGTVSGELSNFWNFSCPYEYGKAKVILENFQIPSEMLPIGSSSHIAFLGLWTSEKFEIHTLACIVK